MTTCKTHIILALMTRVLFVQESIEDCLQEYSGSFADAIVSAVLLFLKNDWETTFGKCSLCFDPFTWVFWAVKQCATINTFYLVICWLFSTFCNQGLSSSFFSHMSWKFYMLLLTLFLTEKGRFQSVFCLLVESKERLFHRFTSNFLNRNSSWQKLHMKPTLQKIPGYKDEISWKTSLWRHKGTSVNILYIKI